ncbi:MAG TPA: heme-copper oxidase subunit III [Herpetosiphonaceae bacterium]
MAQAVAHDQKEHAAGAAHGHGGHHPPTSLGVNTRKLGLWTFISSEAIFFTALISTYLVLKPRNLALGGPVPEDFLGITLTAILAFILLMSSLTMVLALNAVEHNDRRGTHLWLGATILLGLMFLGGQTYEFNKLWSEGFHTVTITKQDGKIEQIGVAEHHLEAELEHLHEEYPGAQIQQGPRKPVTWTTSIFGSTFFTLTGFHGTHVGIGVIWLSIVLAMSLRGAISSRNSLTVEMAGLYWHFVDLVWVAIFTLIYLI